MRFEQALTYEVIVITVFALVYLWYSYAVDYDFGMLADNRWETAQNTLFYSTFVSLGTIAPSFEPRTANARAIMTVHGMIRVMSALYYVLV